MTQSDSNAWLSELPDGRLSLSHAPAALERRRLEVAPLIRTMMAAYLVFWVILALNGAFRSLIQQGAPALKGLVLAMFLLGFGFPLFVRALLRQAGRERLILDPAAGRYEAAQAQGLKLSSRQGKLADLELRCLTLREQRPGKVVRQRWLQQLEIRLAHGERPLMLGLSIGDFEESDTLPPPPLPEAELARVARALGRPLPWELGGNGVVTRQGKIDAKASS